LDEGVRAEGLSKKDFRGADGLVLVEKSEKADVKWRFFNADGSEAEMCGNAGRCLARFAHLKGITGPSLTFETLAGILSAQVNGKRIKLEMTKPHGLKLDEAVMIGQKKQILSSINTGVPHAVIFVDDFKGVDVVREEGRFAITLTFRRAEPMRILFGWRIRLFFRKDL